MKCLLEYLKKQHDERVRKLDAYNEAFAEYEAARKRVDAFGDMGGIEGEIGELETYIDEVENKIAAESAKELLVATVLEDSTAAGGVLETNTTVGDKEVEDTVNEVVVNCKA